MGRVCYGPSLSWAEFVMGRVVQLPLKVMILDIQIPLLFGFYLIPSPWFHDVQMIMLYFTREFGLSESEFCCCCYMPNCIVQGVRQEGN